MHVLPALTLSLSLAATTNAVATLVPGAEVAIAEATWIPAVGSRSPIAASAGDGIGLVLWSDDRGGDGSGSLVATRVSDGGHALDPLGIHLGHLRPAGLLWNGDAFALLTTDYERGIHELTLIGTDGVVQAARRVDVPGRLVAVSPPGSSPRFLLASWVYDSNDSVQTSIAVVDGHGEVIARNVDLPRAAAGELQALPLAVGGNDAFLLLRREMPSSGAPSTMLVADLVSADGELLSSRDAGFVARLDSATLVGTDRGWVLATWGDQLPSRYHFYRLNREGALQSGPHTIPVAFPAAATMPRLHMLDGAVVVTWTTNLDAEAKSISFVGTLAENGDVGGAKGILWEPGFRPPALLLRIGARLFAFSGSVAVRLSESFEPEEVSLLAISAPRQGGVAIGASDEGFLVGWLEEGTGAFVRRVSRSGAFQDEHPIQVDARSAGRISIQSNGEAYLVVLSKPQGVTIRRLRAATGEWMDPVALELDQGGHALASDARDVVMAWIGRCDTGGGSCVRARRIPMTGPLLPDDPISVFRPGTLNPTGVSIASSGSEYLVSWGEVMVCTILCPPSSTPVRAARLRTDGTVIDREPILVDDSIGFGSQTSVAWDGATYTIAWTGWRSGRQRISAARVTPEGAVREADEGGTVIDAAEDAISVVVRLIRYGEGVALLTLTATRYPFAPSSIVLRLVAFDRATPLGEVAARPRVIVAETASEDPAGFAGSAIGSNLLTAYRRLDAAAAHVPRVFMKQFFQASPRRRAASR